jgi:ankyrin repeat protein
MVELLIERGAPLRTKYGRSGHSALSWAVTCESADAAHSLIRLGTEPDLFCSAGLGLLERVQGFWVGDKLRRRPSMTGSSRFSDTGRPQPAPPTRDADQVSDALYIACRCGRTEVARWLLDHGADPNWRGFGGATCLAWAEFSGAAALSGLVRERGGSDHLLDRQYKANPRTFGAMVLAGWGFADRLLTRLLSDPGLVSLATSEGFTLLHAAADGGQLDSARILLQFGADRGVRAAQGRPPADYAVARGHQDLVALFAPEPGAEDASTSGPSGN